MAAGDYSPDPDEHRFPVMLDPAAPTVVPPVVPKAVVGVNGGALTVADHWDDYVSLTGISLGSQKRFRPILVRCGVDLETTRLADVSEEQVKAWVKSLSKSGLSAKTINESYLAAVRAFVNWGIDQAIVFKNPWSKASFKEPYVTTTKPKRPKGLTDKEARLILTETLREPDMRVSRKFAAARRWVPWICAYTGARVNEITQLRKEDISAADRPGDAVWVLLITPEAGTVKNRTAREVPLHPHLIEQGFVDFVRSQPQGPLFYNEERSKGGSDFNPPFRKTGEKIAQWVRDIGVTDDRVAPNHGWRHRFNTQARNSRLIPEIRDAIVGHAPRTEGEEYGDITVEMMWPEICRLPRFDVVRPEGPRVGGTVSRTKNAARVATAARSKERREALKPGETIDRGEASDAASDGWLGIRVSSDVRTNAASEITVDRWTGGDGGRKRPEGVVKCEEPGGKVSYRTRKKIETMDSVSFANETLVSQFLTETNRSDAAAFFEAIEYRDSDKR